jgi:hypothetical protein
MSSSGIRLRPTDCLLFRAIEARKMTETGRIAHVGRKTSAFRDLVGEPDEMTQT